MDKILGKIDLKTTGYQYHWIMTNDFTNVVFSLISQGQTLII